MCEKKTVDCKVWSERERGANVLCPEVDESGSGLVLVGHKHYNEGHNCH